MKHAASRELYAYWQEKRGTRPAPERTEIEPGAIRGVLADAFILALDRGSGHPIRLAGTRLCALFGREIKGESFLDLWASTSRPTMEGLLSILSDECTGTVASATGRNENASSNCCCSRSAFAGRFSRAPSACWRRLKFRHGWEQAPSGR